MMSKAAGQESGVVAPRKLLVAINTMLGFYSLIPAALLVTFYTFVLRARWELGRWPIPMFPDPTSLKTPGIDTHYESVFWLGVSTLCCGLPWMLTLYLRMQLSDRKAGHCLLALPWVALVMAIALDPGNYVSWYLD